MDHQLQLAYLGVEVADPAALHPFFGEVIGLVPGEADPSGAATWRDDGKAHRLIVRAGPADDAVFFGVEADDDATFDAVCGRLDAAGHEVAEGSDEERAARRVDRLVRAATPWGVELELVTGLADAPTPFASALVPGGFLTERVGFGHAVFATPAFEEAHTFVTEVLGFIRSDWIETELAPGVELEVRFYHCNRRHHSIALARAPFELPQRLHHVMFEANERDDVGVAFDRAWASGLPLPNGLGRHDNDGMFSFYVTSPAGFQVEVGYGARLITDGWDDDRRYDRISAWGHQLLRQP